MKQALIGMSIACTIALVGYQAIGQAREQGAAADKAAVEKAIAANEIKINEAFAKKDAATMKSFIADDAVAVETTGPTTVADMLKTLSTMDVKITEQTLSNFRYLWVDANTVIVTYTWTGKGTAMGMPVPSPAYASSVWAKRGAKWLAVYHQETASMPMNMSGMGMKK